MEPGAIEQTLDGLSDPVPSNSCGVRGATPSIRASRPPWAMSEGESLCVDFFITPSVVTLRMSRGLALGLGAGQRQGACHAWFAEPRRWHPT